MLQTSPKGVFDKNDVMHVLLVCAYSCGSAVVTALLILLAHANVPSQYLFVVPIVNALLVAVQRLLAKPPVQA